MTRGSKRHDDTGMLSNEPSLVPSLLLEEVALDDVHPHPRNYQKHPDDEVAHLMESIQSNGLYRNVVIARDGTILAGHGVVEAARRLGHTRIAVHRTAYMPDDPQALKLLVGDNEISHLAEKDDRLLTEMLRELKEVDIGLLGTGYDEMMLANLLMVTRPASEIADLDAAAQWAGMPEYDEGPGQIQIVVNFLNVEDRAEFGQLIGIETGTMSNKGRSSSIWWPERDRDDRQSVRFTGGEENNDE